MTSFLIPIYLVSYILPSFRRIYIYICIYIYVYIYIKLFIEMQDHERKTVEIRIFYLLLTFFRSSKSLVQFIPQFATFSFVSQLERRLPAMR